MPAGHCSEAVYRRRVPTRARSLTDELRRRGDDALVALILRRPDLARPAPGDLTTLVARATTPASLRRALDTVTSAHLAVLEAAMVAGPAPLAGIAALLGKGQRSAVVTRLVRDLEELGLVWNSADGYVAVRTLSAIITEPGGFGPQIPQAPHGAEVEAALADLKPAERRLLEALTWGPPVGALAERDGSPDGGPAARLLDRGLLHRRDADHVLLPRSVAMVLRGGLLRPQVELDSPELATAPDRIRAVDQAAGARAGLLIDQAAELIERWGSDPPRRLRGGGLAVRDLSAVATHLEVGRHEAAWLVETMAAAGLIDSTDEASTAEDPVFAPTARADLWSGSDAAQRWADLAAGWLTMSAAPWTVGSTEGDRARRVNALSVEAGHPAGRQRRQDTLRLLAGESAALADPTALHALLHWMHPLRAARSTEPDLTVLLDEAQWAGVVAEGVMTTAGRALVQEGPERAAAAMATHIPAPVDRVLVQADLTVVAPGRVDGKLRSTLHLVSDIESRGGASVHRFSEASLRRALDAGWTADRILTELTAVSATGIPQPLEYLVRDVARRHGVARIGAAGCYVRSDEPALLDRMLADRALAALNLHRIAPTVLISPLDAGSALDLLRERAYGPVAEQAGGHLVLGVAGRATRAAPRSATAGRPAAVHRSGVDHEVAAQVVAALRSGERVRERSGSNGTEAPSTDPALTQSALGAAAADGAAVVLGYADDAGGVTRMVFWPDGLEPGRVRGHLEGDHHTRRLLLHRITGAVRAT